MMTKLIRFLILILTISIIQNSIATEAYYWDTQRKGANIFNENMTDNIWKSASEANIKIVRLAPDKWHGEKKDFLIGDADNYTNLVTKDLNQLKKVLAQANKNNIKVVLTMLSLPGARWRQLNHNKDDNRLWHDKKYQEQAIKFWVDLATALKDNPAIAGYNIINEPHPEVAFNFNDFLTQDFQKFANKVSGTNADLSLFYQHIVNAIRKVDRDTPIILDIGMYADPRAFAYFKPVNSEHIIYAFHMYEPYDYTNKQRNNAKYSYPGKMTIGNNHKMIEMSKDKLQEIYFEPIIQWQKRYHIPSNRIFAEEFGANRMTKGLDIYLHDLIEVFNKNGWHWTFYSFREDTWDGMDYELGNKPLGKKYWDSVKQGKHPNLVRIDNPIWRTLKQGLNAQT